MNFDRYTSTTTDSGGVGRESGTTNEIIRNTGNEKIRTSKKVYKNDEKRP